MRVGWLVAVIALVPAGCYRSHQRAAAPVDAAVPSDVSRPDAPHDAPCRRLVAGPSVLLDGPGGVTPRLLGLDGGEVGIAYVTPGGGDPTAVRWERLGARLERLTGPLLIATDSWTWAEPARRRGEVMLAYGGTASEPSTLLRMSVDGTISERSSVPLVHPEVLRETARGLFWLGFDSGETNAYEIAHVGLDGSLSHAAVRIDVGRYGSGFGVAASPDGRGQLIAYPSEGPRGVRRVRVRSISDAGVLSDERTLSEDGADRAVPVFVGGGLFVLYRTDASLRLAALDPRSLETLSERSLPRMEGPILAAEVAGRLVVGSYDAPTLRAFDAERPAEIVAMTAPRAGFGGSITWTVVPGALVVTAGVVDVTLTHPWVARIECAP